MLRHHLLLAFRSLRRHRAYALLNAAGLTTGLAVAALVLAYVGYERAFDRHLPDAERTFRLESNYRASWYSTIGFAAFSDETDSGQQRLSAELEASPLVEAAALVHLEQGARYVRAGGERWTESRILYTATGDQTTAIFGLDFVAGEAASALDRMRSAVLTASAAERYFGQGEAVGQTIRIDTTDYAVTGVVADPPATQHIGYDLILRDRIPNWGAFAYVRLVAGADPEQAAEQATQAIFRLRPTRADDPLHRGERLVPVTRLRTHAPTLYDAVPPGDARYLYLFAVAAALLLAIAASNYANLSAALYAGRAREIGVRKSMGAGRGRIALSFWAEAVGLSVACVVPALLIAWGALPLLNEAMGTAIDAARLVDPGFLLLIVGLAVATGLAAGAYPALALAGVRAVDLFGGPAMRGSAMRGSAAGGVGRPWVRRVLVGGQFALLVGLASGALVVQRQIAFLGSKDLGFDPSGVVYFQGLNGADDFRALRASLSDVEGVSTLGMGPLPGPGFNRTTFRAPDSDVVLDNANQVYTDRAYFDVMRIDAGDALDELDAGAERVFVANEVAVAALRRAGGSGEAVVMEPEYVADDGTRGYAERIGGTLPDWHLFSLREAVRPLFVSVTQEPTWVWNAVARVERRDAQTLAAVERAWNRALPDAPFAPGWVADDLDALYEQERRAGVLGTVLAALAVGLTLLGLIGVVAFAAARRRKEIGVRKALGARPAGLVALLARELVWMVIAGFALAAPVAYLASDRWLGTFAYRADAGPLLFLSVGIGLLVLALAVTSAQTWRAATVNPADVLRDE